MSNFFKTTQPLYLGIVAKIKWDLNILPFIQWCTTYFLLVKKCYKLPPWFPLCQFFVTQ